MEKEKDELCKMKTCAICSAIAQTCNFGVVSCESCKAFFRRNAHKDDMLLRCHANCDINEQTRSKCRSCRLKKCFEKGMNKNLILSEEQKEKRNLKIGHNRVRKDIINLTRRNNPVTHRGRNALPTQNLDKDTILNSISSFQDVFMKSIESGSNEDTRSKTKNSDYIEPIPRDSKITSLDQYLEHEVAKELNAFLSEETEYLTNSDDLSKINTTKSGIDVVSPLSDFDMDTILTLAQPDSNSENHKLSMHHINKHQLTNTEHLPMTINTESEVSEVEKIIVNFPDSATSLSSEQLTTVSNISDGNIVHIETLLYEESNGHNSQSENNQLNYLDEMLSSNILKRTDLAKIDETIVTCLPQVMFNQTLTPNQENLNLYQTEAGVSTTDQQLYYTNISNHELLPIDLTILPPVNEAIHADTIPTETLTLGQTEVQCSFAENSISGVNVTSSLDQNIFSNIHASNNHQVSSETYNPHQTSFCIQDLPMVDNITQYKIKHQAQPMIPTNNNLSPPDLTINLSQTADSNFREMHAILNDVSNILLEKDTSHVHSQSYNTPNENPINVLQEVCHNSPESSTCSSTSLNDIVHCEEVGETFPLDDFDEFLDKHFISDSPPCSPNEEGNCQSIVYSEEVQQHIIENMKPELGSVLFELKAAFAESFDKPVKHDIKDSYDETGIINDLGVLTSQIVSFGKNISAFMKLDQADQITLVKGSFVDLLVMRLLGDYNEKEKCFEIRQFHPGNKMMVKKVHTCTLPFKNNEVGQTLMNEFTRFIQEFSLATHRDPGILMCMSGFLLFSTKTKYSYINKDHIQHWCEMYLKTMSNYIDVAYPNGEVKLSNILAAMKDGANSSVVLQKAMDRLDLNQLSPIILELFYI